jgi:hypothetical protein
MKKLLVLTAAAGAAVAMVVITSTGSAQPGARTITVIEKDRSEKQDYVDNPPRGTKRHPALSVGDLFTLTGPLFDQAKPVGELDAAFTTLKGSKYINRLKLVGHGAFNLQYGSIVFEGIFGGRDAVVHLAVLGGTEAYEGARGSVTITQTKTGSVDAIHLLP